MLEKLYPYNVFVSVGVIIDQFECSICGLDIYSESCPHLPGELYRRVVARAVVKEIVGFDHVALVTDPADKRRSLEAAVA